MPNSLNILNNRNKKLAAKRLNKLGLSCAKLRANLYLPISDHCLLRLTNLLWPRLKLLLWPEVEKIFFFLRTQYFLSIFNHFKKNLRQNVAQSWIEMLLSPIFCLNLTILNSFAEKKIFFFILFKIFSANPGFWEYFLRTRFAESTTFSTSGWSHPANC